MEEDYKLIFLIAIAILLFIFAVFIIAFTELIFYQKERVISCLNNEECIKYIKDTKKIPSEELLNYFNIENK